MQTSFAEDLRTLIHLVQSSSKPDASFRALLVLLSDAPDSRNIVDAIGQIDPSTIGDASLKVRAGALLEKANAADLSIKWSPAAQVASNVVSIKTQETLSSSVDRLDFSDIGGLEHVKNQIRRRIITPFSEKAGLFSRFKRKAGGGVLVYGPPGCGKTMLARALATECRATFVNIRPGDILDQFVGNAEKKIAHLFDRARASRPVVMFFDEIEALAQRRQFDTSARINTVVSALLSEMDGFGQDKDGILFLGATNVPWSLDIAFRRPGRFDRTLFVPPPDRVAREFILGRLLADRPVQSALDRRKIAERTSGYSGADLAAVVDTAVDIAIDESPSEDQLRPLSDDHFETALREVKSSVGEWLAQARAFAEYSNENGLYDDLAEFLRKYAR